MNSDAKYRYFQLLVQLGYKEIEISYPSASQTEYDFTRRLITTGAIPDGVTIQVMAPCREELIRSTIEAVRGANRVIVHIHLSTSPCFQEVVFNVTEEQNLELAVRCTRVIRELTKDSIDPETRNTEWTLEFTPENFQETTPKFGLQICEAVKAAWEPTEQNPIIFNIAATVEAAMPNVFADQVEYFCSQMSERKKVCVSLHNHNDRGCAVAATEMGQLAGADRVEGCLFGNGERTGNVDLVTLALNLFTHGVNPGIDFSDVTRVVEMVEEFTRIPVHLRAPYAGKYTFCTFTGTHQDAIRKGYKSRAFIQTKLGQAPKWRMPYLAMDPDDLGRKHEAVIRLNAQSGKGGIGWLVNEVFEMEMPRELEVAFTKIVKSHADKHGGEITHDMIEHLFRSHYMHSEPSGVQLVSSNLDHDVAHYEHSSSGSDFSDGDADSDNSKSVAHERRNSVHIQAIFAFQGVRHQVSGIGQDVLTSVLHATKGLGYEFELVSHRSDKCRSDEATGDTMECTSQVAISVKLASEGNTAWGVGIHQNAVCASLQAVSQVALQATHGCTGPELTGNRSLLQSRGYTLFVSAWFKLQM